jgi:NAD(P)-dependent dehydrogenase (short-subunit alcohol dehydrogenase family)
LKNKINALIVGANGGIGLGFVRKLLEDEGNAKIYATYRHQQLASELKSLERQYGDQISCLEMDITDETKIEGVISSIQKEAEKLHLAINCAGILHEGALQPEKSLKQINSEHLLRYFQVNSIGAVLLAKHLLPLFRHSDRALLATLSAKLGSIGDNHLGGWYGYRASKAALNMFVRTIAIEYRRNNPNSIVVALHPGTTDTHLSQPFQKNVPKEKLFSIDRTVTQLLEVIENLNPKDSGQFFSWDGTPLPW